MAVWVVRAGREGESEAFDLQNGVATIAWSKMPDLTNFSSREQIEQVYRQVYPENTSKMLIANNVGQIYAFRSRIKSGDLVALPLHGPQTGNIAFGRVTGPYRYHADFPVDVRHTLAVEWNYPQVARTNFEKDILNSFGSIMTVFQVQRNDAEERIRALLAGQPVVLSAEEQQNIQQDQELPRIFISHSHYDTDISSRLAAELNLVGANVWLDSENMQYGNYIAQIDEALLHCDWVILVLSPSAMESRAVVHEISAAISLYFDERLAGVIPFVVTPVDFQKLRPTWRPFQFVDATNDFEKALTKLLSKLRLTPKNDEAK